MERGYLSRKHYFFLALAFTLMAFVAVFILWFAIDQRYRSNGAVVAVIAAAGAGIPIWIGVAVAIVLPLMSAGKPSQPVNYPRIEHLRIAGKYAPTGAAKMGVSPLHLR